MSESEKQSPWVTLGLGVLMFAIGIGCFFWFNHLEQSGAESFRAHVVIVLLYSMLGKWGVLGAFSLLGTVLLGVGLKGIATGN